MSEIKIFTLTPDVYDYYRLNVRGNEMTSPNTAARKLTRNIKLALEIKRGRLIKRILGLKLYQYGNLHIHVKGNVIVKLENHFGKQHKNEWKFDPLKYIQVSDELNLHDEKYFRIKKKFKL